MLMVLVQLWWPLIKSVAPRASIDHTARSPDVHMARHMPRVCRLEAIE